MANGIDVDQKDLDILVSAALDYTTLIAATTITVGQGGRGGLGGLSGVQIAALGARYFAARRGESKTGV